MQSFDITVATKNAYLTIWQARSYLLKMALVPLTIKTICMFLSLQYGEDNNILRMSLFMIPAYFVEGWFLAHLVRFVVLGQRWPFQSSGNKEADLPQLYNRARGILSGTIAFVLTNLIIAGYFSLFMQYIPLEIKPEEADPQIAAMGFLMLVSSFLAFRFIWFYIPLSINIAPSYYFRKVQKISITFYMLGLWVVCFVPAILCVQILSSFILGISGGLEGQELSSAGELAIVIIRVVFDMLKNMLCTAGIAYAFIEMFPIKNK